MDTGIAFYGQQHSVLLTNVVIKAERVNLREVKKTLNRPMKKRRVAIMQKQQGKKKTVNLRTRNLKRAERAPNQLMKKGEKTKKKKILGILLTKTKTLLQKKQ